MISKFQNYFAEADGGGRAVFSLDDTYDLNENQLCPYCVIKLFGIPAGVEESVEEQIVEGEAEGAVHIATLTGFVILNDTILRKGLSPVLIADDHSGDLGYAIKALTEDGAPLSDELDLQLCTSLFYIYEFIFEEEYRDREFISKMIKKIPDLLLYTSYVYPDMLVYYPKPLPYEKDALVRAKEAFAALAAKEVIERMKQARNGEYVDDGKPHLELGDEQLNIIMGSRNEGDSYPAAAIDRSEWELYESAGFREVGNSRLLYAWVDEM